MNTELIRSNLCVTHVVPKLDGGGVERLLLDLIDSIPGVEFSVIAVNAGGIFQKDFEKRCRTVVIGNNEDDPHKTYMWLSPSPVLRMSQEIKHIQPDILQTHTFGASTRGRAAAKLAKVPVIIDTLHNTYTWKDSHALKIDRLLGRITDRIVCVSNAVMDYAVSQNPGIPACKYEVIHNGVNTEHYFRRERTTEMYERFGIDPDELVVGSVCRLVSQKRTRDLVEAAPHILLRFPNAKFLIVGAGPEYENLVKQVEHLRLGDRFIFTGMLDDTASTYSVMDVFAQTSEREGFGLSLAEAMASGVSVVAAKTGAIPEIVRNGINGSIYEVGDVESLAESINKLLASASMRSHLGTIAAKEIRERFSITKMSEGYRELWYRLHVSKLAD